MRWPVYFIFAYLMLGLQVGMSRFVAFHETAANLGLIAVLFIAFQYASRERPCSPVS